MVEQCVPAGMNRQLEPITNAQFPVDNGQLIPDSLLPKPKPRGNLAVGRAFEQRADQTSLP